MNFGLAKRLTSAGALAASLEVTQYGQVVGTLSYMSPEQATLEYQDLDTRSDLYSLGVVLFELFVGSTPLKMQNDSQETLLELLESVRQSDSVLPSKRLAEFSFDRLNEIASKRATSVSGLRKQVKGDLDWILGKALSNDRSSRYASVKEFSDDINRYLKGELILAHPPSRLYRWQKYVQKNKVEFSFIGSFVLLLGLGLLGTGWFAFKARNSEQAATRRAEQLEIEFKRALAAEQEAEIRLKQAERSRRMSRIAASRANTILDIVTHSFSSPNPTLRGRPAMEAREVLFQANQAMSRSTLDPEGKLQLAQTLFDSLFNMGEFDQARKVALDALQVARTKYGKSHANAIVLNNNVAICLARLGRTEEALEMFERTAAELEKRVGKHHRQTLVTQHQQAIVFLQAGEAAQSLEILQRIESDFLAEFELLTPEGLGFLTNLASVYGAVENWDQAIMATQRVVQLVQQNHGRHHPLVLQGKHNLALQYLGKKESDRAVKLLTSILPEVERKFGVTHPKTLNTLISLATAFQQNGETQSSVDFLKRMVKKIEPIADKVPLQFVRACNNLADLEAENNEFEAARRLLEKAAKVAKTTIGNSHPNSLSLRMNQAKLQVRMGNLRAANANLASLIDELKQNPSGNQKLLADCQQLFELTTQNGLY